MSKFAEKNKLGKEVEKDMRAYLDYLLREDHNRKLDEEEYLNVMPTTLRKRVFADKYYKLLLNIPVFRKNFRIEFLRRLAVQFKEKILGPGDEISPVT